MSRKIYCVYLKQQSEGLDRHPWPGGLGERIYDNISTQAWQLWQERQVILINEYQLNSMDERAVELLEKHMLGFLFGEGDHLGTLAGGFKETL